MIKHLCDDCFSKLGSVEEYTNSKLMGHIYTCDYCNNEMNHKQVHDVHENTFDRVVTYLKNQVKAHINYTNELEDLEKEAKRKRK